jgi:hypothetical protein
MFNYDWFTGHPFENQRHEARTRCARKRFTDVQPDQEADHPAFQKFVSELEVRVLVYLRDGFSYEMKELVDIGLRGSLTFECEPVDDQYKVGSFIVSLPFDEIVRVEVFAVHPTEKPEDTPLITGFRTSPADPMLREESSDPGTRRSQGE